MSQATPSRRESRGAVWISVVALLAGLAVLAAVAVFNSTRGLCGSTHLSGRIDASPGARIYVYDCALHPFRLFAPAAMVIVAVVAVTIAAAGTSSPKAMRLLPWLVGMDIVLLLISLYVGFAVAISV